MRIAVIPVDKRFEKRYDENVKQKVVQRSTGIVIDPSIHSGRPIIRGTRVPVDIVVGRVAAGMSIPAVADEYGITEKDVYNALRYARLSINDPYTYHVAWSEEDGEYLGLCAEFPSLSWLAAEPEAALRGIRRVVADVVADLSATS